MAVIVNSDEDKVTSQEGFSRFKPAPADFTCRSCGGGSNDIGIFLDLGMMPPSDALRRLEHLNLPEKKYPLKAGFCQRCTLVQITETVPPEELFSKDYVYYSSFSDALLEHTRKNVEETIHTRRLGPEHQVIELASNDGYLLQFYKNRGIKVLGIDPAQGQARTANQRGIPTLCTFFGRELGAQMRAEGMQADVVHGNNVLAHVADTNGFVAGISEILKDNGIAILEIPYLGDLIHKCQFDTIYHEHLCYFSVTSLMPLFRRHGLYLNDVRPQGIHGGSLRIYLGKTNAPERSVAEALARERAEGIDRPNHYADFADRVRGIKDKIVAMVREIKNGGKRLAAYGAAAKGTILLNYIGLGTESLEFVVDRNVHKHGRFMPGVHLPIRPVEALLQDMPDYTLILPWNFKDEILDQQSEYRRRGGRFIIPIPSPEVV